MQYFLLPLLLLACAPKQEPEIARAEPVKLAPAEVWTVAEVPEASVPVAAPNMVESPKKDEPPQVLAFAHLVPQRGSKIAGEVAFSQVGDVVYVSINITGAAPGEHYARIHGGGSCAANPHGDELDLGTLTANANGVAHANVTLKRAALAEGDDALLGRPVIVDDGKSCGILAMPSS